MSNLANLKAELVELVYGFLAEERAEELRAQIASEPEVADLYAEVLRKASLIADASRIVTDKSLFGDIGHVSVSNMRQAFSRRQAHAHTRDTINHIMNYAAVCLVILTICGYAYQRYQLSHVAGVSLEMTHRVVAVAPEQLVKGLPQTLEVEVSDMHGERQQVPVRIAISDQQDLELASVTESTDSDGKLLLPLARLTEHLDSVDDLVGQSVVQLEISTGKNPTKKHRMALHWVDASTELPVAEKNSEVAEGRRDSDSTQNYTTQSLGRSDAMLSPALQQDKLQMSFMAEAEQADALQSDASQIRVPAQFPRNQMTSSRDSYFPQADQSYMPPPGVPGPRSSIPREPLSVDSQPADKVFAGVMPAAPARPRTAVPMFGMDAPQMPDDMAFDKSEWQKFDGEESTTPAFPTVAEPLAGRVPALASGGRGGTGYGGLGTTSSLMSPASSAGMGGGRSSPEFFESPTSPADNLLVKAFARQTGRAIWQVELQVTDANGHGVDGAEVAVSVLKTPAIKSVTLDNLALLQGEYQRNIESILQSHHSRSVTVGLIVIVGSVILVATGVILVVMRLISGTQMLVIATIAGMSCSFVWMVMLRGQSTHETASFKQSTHSAPLISAAELHDSSDFPLDLAWQQSDLKADTHGQLRCEFSLPEDVAPLCYFIVEAVSQDGKTGVFRSCFNAILDQEE